jgi:putative DNA primase/helicase
VPDDSLQDGEAYGSLVRKGESTPERPHRLSSLRRVPDVLVPVTLEQINSVAPKQEIVTETTPTSKTKAKPKLIIKAAPQNQKSAYDPITTDKIEACLTFYKLEWTKVNEHIPGQWKWDIECPWQGEHSDGRPEACVFLTNGIPGFKGLHTHCVNRGWKDFRSKLETMTGGKFWFSDNLPDVTFASAPTTASLVLKKFTNIKAEAIQWLWPGVIAVGKLTLFVGNPGVGKGLVTMDIVSRVTTKTAWPNRPNDNPVMDVLLVSSEDAPEDTLKPRLIAAGADHDHVSNIECTKTEKGDKVFSLDTDLPALRKALEENPAVKLLVIDPVMSHLGDANGNREQELRNILGPLGDLAKQHKIAIVLVAHFNKRADADTIARVGGAMAMVGVVRNAWTFTESKEQEGRVMLPLKNNLSKDEGGFNYDTIGVPVEVEDGDGKTVTVDIGRITWGGESSEVVTSSLISTDKKLKTKNLTKVEKAMVWLASMMPIAGQAYSASELTKAGEPLGFNTNTLHDAKKKLGVTSKQGEGGWFWTYEPIGGVA